MSIHRAFGPATAPAGVQVDQRLDATVELDRVRKAVAARPDILVIDGHFDTHRMQALVELCDCFVWLHRCEGFGLNLAAAMAAGGR